jgi:hypothetical protein
LTLGAAVGLRLFKAGLLGVLFQGVVLLYCGCWVDFLLRGKPLRGLFDVGVASVASVLVGVMLCRARLVPLLYGALAGLLVALVGCVVFFSALAGKFAPAQALGQGGQVLYISSLVGGLGVGVFCAAPRPRSALLPALLAWAAIGGLLYSDETNVFITFTALALGVTAMGRGIAAYYGSEVGLVVLGAHSAFATSILFSQFVLAISHQLGVQIDRPLAIGLVALLSAAGTAIGGRRAARMPSKFQALLRELALPENDRDADR